MIHSSSRQQGIALLISLILLLLLTVIAITAATQSTLQERMASNSQMQNTAFQNVESGFMRWDAGNRDAGGKLQVATVGASYSDHNFKVEVPGYPLNTVSTYIRPDLSQQTFDLNVSSSLKPYITEVIVTGKACPTSGTCDVDDKTDGLARAQTTQGLSYLYDYTTN